MATVTFDTLKFVEKLRAAGVPEAQAKAESEALVSVFAEAMDQLLATKEDIRAVRSDIAAQGDSLRADMATQGNSLRADMATLEKSLRADMAALEKNLKGDMAALEKNLRGDMATQDGWVKAEFKEVKAEFKEVKADIVMLKRDTYVIKWMMGMVLASVISLVLKAFFDF